jgi:hypothetical protein
MKLLDRHHTVSGGARVRLRLPQVGDRHELRTFLERLGIEDLDTRWDGAREAIAGIAVGDDADGAPTLLAADPEVAGLLAQALADHAGTARRRVA